MTEQDIKSRIENISSHTQAEVIDLTGTHDHYQAVVVSSAFSGKITVQQHRIIYDLFQKEIASGELHALTLKTFSPEQYQKYIKEN